MKSPNLYNIIFSDKISYRWKRHLFFWLAVFLYHLVRIGLMYPPEKLRSNPYSLLEMTLYWGVLINMLFSYPIVYFMVPKYFKKKKYIQFAIGLFVMLLIIQSMAAFH